MLKKRVLDFINRDLPEQDGADHTKDNAQKSLLGDLWIEMSDAVRHSQLLKSLKTFIYTKPAATETVFMAGFYCGYLQGSEKEDHGKE